MADLREVLIKPRKVEITPSTMTSLLTKVRGINTIASNGNTGVAQDELFAVTLEGTAGLFIGDAGGKMQDVVETDTVSTVLTPVATQVGLLPVDVLDENTYSKANDLMVHMYDANETVTQARHRAVSLLSLSEYIGGAAVNSIGKVKISETDGANWLAEKLETESLSCITLTKSVIGLATNQTIKFKATPILSSQFQVNASKELTIISINGGTI